MIIDCSERDHHLSFHHVTYLLSEISQHLTINITTEHVVDCMGSGNNFLAPHYIVQFRPCLKCVDYTPRVLDDNHCVEATSFTFNVSHLQLLISVPSVQVLVIASYQAKLLLQDTITKYVTRYAPGPEKL